MKKLKYHWKVVLSLSIVLLAIGSYLGNKRYQAYKEQQAKDYYGKFLSYNPPKKLEKYNFLNKQVIAVSWENTDKTADRYISAKNIKSAILGSGESTSNFIVTEQHRLRGYIASFGLLLDEGEDFKVRNTLEKGEYWSVKVYRKTGQKLNPPTEIDILRIVRKHKPDYSPGYLQVVEKSGKSYLTISLYKPSKLNAKTHKTSKHRYDSLWVDLDTQKVVNSKRLQATSPLDSTASDRFSYASDLKDRLSNQGINFYDNTTISLTKKGIKNSKHWRIAKQYPEAYKILKNGGKLYLMQDKTDMDYTAKILQLFAPKGTDIFDGTTIPADDTIDGQEHTVHSYEEFKKFYKIEDTE